MQNLQVIPPKIHFITPKNMFHYSMNEVLMLLIICNIYGKVQYVHFNIFNFKIFCEGYQLVVSITIVNIYRLKLFKK